MIGFKRALQFGELFFNSYQYPKREAEVALLESLQKPDSFLITNPNTGLNGKEFFYFLWICFQRWRGYSMDHIRGFKEWAGLIITVSEDTLIPRDETEILLGYIQNWAYKKQVTSILDIGTGSGCIAIWLKKNFPTASVFGSDISKKALRIASKNAQTHEQSISFILSNLFTNISKQSFDIIVANLPYVPETNTPSKTIQKEPATAIFSGIDGMDAYRDLANSLEEKSIIFQVLFIEFLPSSWNDIQQIFSAYQVQPLKDIGGDIYFAAITPLEPS